MTTITIDDLDVAALGAADARGVGFVQARPRTSAADARLVEVPLRRESFDLLAEADYDISFRRVPALADTVPITVPDVDRIGLAELLGVHVDRPLDPTSRPSRWRLVPPEEL